MSIYLKITTAVLLAASVVEFNASAGGDGFARLTLAFVQASFLLAGAFFIVSAIGNFLRHQTAEAERRVLQTTKVDSGRFINHPKSGYRHIGVVH
jgi:hypothetical protein